jgi:mono/diheme cytochrome c family protein
VSRNDAILTVFAAILVVFSLAVALVVPRRDPRFPGRNMRAFALVAVLLVAAMLAAVEVFGEAHHFGEAEGAEATETGETRPTETDGGDGDGEGEGEGAGAGDPAAGQEVFASAGCGSCHVFAPAGSSGTVGPSLDESDVTFDAAVEQIRSGGGGMPPFEGQLSEQQILDVAAFVTQAGG